MKNRRDEKIRQLEQRLLKANRVSPDELREIVCAPHLLEQISARIKRVEKTEARQTRAARIRVPVSGWRKISLAFGGAAVFLAFAGGALFFSRADFSASRLTPAVAAPETENHAAASIDESAAPDSAALEKRVVARKSSFKNKSLKLPRRASHVNPTNKPRPEASEPEEAFYPLAFAENLEEAKEAGQVVRVELSRSSLLALGVNPPSEDENLKVKTDLLIGADGVARGIRFVR